MHTDLNAAQNIEQRRALSIGSVKQGKVAVLAELVRQFRERKIRSIRSYLNGNSGVPTDPRSKNFYFEEVLDIGEVKLSQSGTKHHTKIILSGEAGSSQDPCSQY